MKKVYVVYTDEEPVIAFEDEEKNKAYVKNHNKRIVAGFEDNLKVESAAIDYDEDDETKEYNVADTHLLDKDTIEALLEAGEAY